MYRLAYVILVILAISLVGCDRKHEGIVLNNPFDPDNQETQGDPYNLRIVVTENSVTLQWDDIPNIYGVDVYRSTSPDGVFVKIGMSTSREYIDTNIQPGETYYYQLRAYRDGTVSSPLTVGVLIPGPALPVNATEPVDIPEPEPVDITEPEPVVKRPIISADSIKLMFKISYPLTESIAIHDNYLWVSGWDGGAKTRKLSLNDRSVITSVNYMFSGLTFVDDRLYGIGGQPEDAVDRETIYEIDPENGSILSSLPLQFHVPGPCGLAHDGNYFWISNGAEYSKIYKVNPEDGSLVDSFDYGAGFSPAGLAHDGTHLWIAEYNPDKIHKVDPNNGSIISSFDTPDEGPNGNPVAADFDDEFYLWVSIEEGMYRIGR